MQFNLETPDGMHVVSDYGDGFIEISGQRYTSGVCVYKREPVTIWKENNPQDLQLESFSEILSYKPEILLLGTGKTLQFPPKDVLPLLFQEGTVLETMDTSAACRTYNVLVSERRRVAAALMLP